MADRVQDERASWSWRCLHCRGPLAADARGLHCAACRTHYPRIAGIPILVRNPNQYLRSELAALTRASDQARRRKASLDGLVRDAGLPAASLDRHRDILDTEIARAETLLALLTSAAEAAADDTGEVPGTRSSGWTTEALLPYLLRDWTGTAELEAMTARIGTVLRQVFPDPSGKSVVFAACGAAGLLTGLSMPFERILGFDLTLPVLRAARHLLDGNELDIALPRAISPAGSITLRKRSAPPVTPRIELTAMDAFDTAFADGSVECVITSFLIDLIPEPQKLADEIHRILCRDGVWINYGPSGPLSAFRRFDQVETAAFFEASGFIVAGAEAYRSTYLDLTRECPTWSFQSHVCYLTWARKAERRGETPALAWPDPASLPELVPLHFPGSTLIQRQGLSPPAAPTMTFRSERIPGRASSVPIGADAARMLALVDGDRTVHDIADRLERETPDLSQAVVLEAFERFFRQGMLSWRGR